MSRGEVVMNTNLNIRIQSDLLAALRKAKWKLEMDTSEIVRNAVMEYLENHLTSKEKNKSPFKEIL